MKNTCAIALALILAADCQEPAGGPLREGSLESAGVDEAPIEALIERVRSGELRNVHAILLVKGGELVVEEYFGGWTRDRLHYTASVSKSVTSLLVGSAMQLGILEGIDEGILDRPVVDLFPDYRELILADEAKERLLFRHVLSMTAGLEWDEASHPYGDPRNDCTRAENSEDPVAFVLGRPVTDEPGTRFEYNGGLSILLSHLLTERSGLTAAKLAEEVLFGPLGIEDDDWEELANGLTDTDGGLHMRPLDLAKIGVLALNKGRWNGEQLVSPEWLEESVRRRVETGDGPGYGFQWWCGDLLVEGTEVHTFFASGHGGQKLFVVPSLDAVVVVAQQVFDNPAGELNNLAILTSHVLPALLPAAARPEPFVLQEPDRYVGEYASDRTEDEASVELADGKLLLIGPDGSRLELLATGKNRFECVLMRILEVPVSFQENDAGRIAGLTIRLGFADRVYRRMR